LLLYTFFSLRKAESRPYTNADRKQLFVVPILIGLTGAAFGFMMFRNVLGAIGICGTMFGVHAFACGRMLLSFNGYRVFEGAWARIGALVFILFGSYITYSVLMIPARQAFVKPTAGWQGQYSFPSGQAGNCNSAHRITITGFSEGRALEYGQYAVDVASMVDCHSDTVVGVPLYDDIHGYAAERDSVLVIWDDIAHDTLFVLTRREGAVQLLATGKRFQVASY